MTTPRTRIAALLLALGLFTAACGLKEGVVVTSGGGGVGAGVPVEGGIDTDGDGVADIVGGAATGGEGAAGATGGAADAAGGAAGEAGGTAGGAAAAAKGKIWGK